VRIENSGELIGPPNELNYLTIIPEKGKRKMKEKVTLQRVFLSLRVSR